MVIVKYAIIAAAMAAASLGMVSAAKADQGGMGEMSLPAPEGCAPMQWNISNVNGELHGIIWYTDGQGFGSAIGETDPATGAFTVRVTPVFGSMAPQGEITGRVENGNVHVRFHGGKCADMKAVFKLGTHKATPE